MKTKIGKCLLLLFAFTLASCQDASSQIDSTISTSAVDLGGETNIKNVVTYLHNNRNYKIHTQANQEDNISSWDSYYTDYYYYSSFDEEGYCSDDNGSFKVDLYSGNYVSSELLFDDNNNSISDVWSGNLFVSFSNLDLDNFTSEETETNISNKTDKLYLMDMLKIDRGLLTSIESFKMEISEEETLDIKISSPSVTYSAEINYKENSSLENLDNYLENNSYYETSQEEQYFQNSFEADNYERVIYDETGETIAGIEHFTPNYYYGEYTQSTQEENSVSSAGYVRLEDYSSNGKTYSGIYYFYITSQGIGMTSVSDDLTYTMNSFMNYPSNLLALSNLQYFQYFETLGEFVTIDKEIAEDFMDNFQVRNMFPNQTLEATELSFKMFNSFSEDYSVTFTISFTIDESPAYMEFEFENFGSANIDQVDQTFGFQS